MHYDFVSEFSYTGLVRRYLDDYARPTNKNYLIGNDVLLCCE